MSRSALRWFQVGATFLKTYGYLGLRRRAVHELRKRGGSFSFLQQPAGRTYPGVHGYAFNYAPAGDWRGLSPAQLERIARRGSKVVDGWHEAYGHEWRRLPETVQQWRTHPISGFEFPSVAWWRVPMLPRQADIKDVWEPGRFAWVYDLVRAYAATRDDAYASAFHVRLSQWMAANPPFQGPQWACGQETAIRALAILHAQDSLPPQTTDVAAAERTLQVLGWSGERIADAIGYGLSQRNNHGISEAAGLVHLGARLRGLHSDADDWLRAGSALLDEQILDQFATDGWYAQHSFTYMRVALEQALLARRVLRATGSDLSAACLSRLQSAYDLLVLLVDAETGVVPNHGANDGGRVLPYSTAPYRDFRPLLTLAAILLERAVPADIPIDDEVVRWLGVPEPRRDSARADGVHTGSSGWAVARVRDAVVFLRAGTYSHRPSHLDALHVDVRFGAREVVIDPGTFSYNAPPPWRNALAAAVVHNGPVLDALEPAQRGPRFLWYSWPAARVVQTLFEADRVRLIAEVPARVRREITVAAAQVRVVDSVLDEQVSSVQVTWLLHPDVQGEDLVQSVGAESIAAHEGDVTGWFSPTYGLRLPSRVLRVRVARGAEKLTCATTIHAPSRSPA